MIECLAWKQIISKESKFCDFRHHSLGLSKISNSIWKFLHCALYTFKLKTSFLYSVFGYATISSRWVYIVLIFQYTEKFPPISPGTSEIHFVGIFLATRDNDNMQTYIFNGNFPLLFDSDEILGKWFKMIFSRSIKMDSRSWEFYLRVLMDTMGGSQWHVCNMTVNRLPVMLRWYFLVNMQTNSVYTPTYMLINRITKTHKYSKTDSLIVFDIEHTHPLHNQSKEFWRKDRPHSKFSFIC